MRRIDTIPPVRWIDGHVDLAYLAVNGRDVRAPADPSLGCVSIPALHAGSVEMIFATIFTEPGLPSADQPHLYAAQDPESAFEAGMRQLECYRGLQQEGLIQIIRTADDLHRGGSALKVLLLMEGADPIRSPDDAAFWFDQGVRMVGLAWAAGTRYAGGNSTGGPLTAQGGELIAALDELGVIHDVSHLSDAALESAAGLARGPMVATHSNCRALLEPSQRHLRDDQIRAVAMRGGIVGLNLYSPFLARGRRAEIGDCIAHLEHVSSVAGHRACVALGSDMDGGFGPDKLPVGLDHPAKLQNLADALQQRGWPRSDVESFAFANWRRFLASALPA